MRLIIDDPASFSGATPEGTIDLVYGTMTDLVLECVDTHGAPVDVESMGMARWAAVCSAMADGSMPMAVWGCAAEGNAFTVGAAMFPVGLYGYVAGHDRAAFLELNGYADAADTEPMRSVAFPVMLHPGRATDTGELEKVLLAQLAAAVDRAYKAAAEAEAMRDQVIADYSDTLTGVKVGGVLQPVQDRVAELETGSGDMTKSVYDTDDDGVVDDAEHADTAGYADTAGSAVTAESATSAQTAASADYATSAGSAGYATQAGEAANADYATNAGHASTADSATTATSATSATSAGSAASVPWSGVTGKPSFDYIPTSEKGAANGVATLDENGKVTGTELPAMDYAQSPVVLSVAGQAPTASTEGEPGRRCVNTANGKAWTLTAKTNAGTEQEPAYSYTWTDDINAKGGNIDKLRVADQFIGSGDGYVTAGRHSAVVASNSCSASGWYSFASGTGNSTNNQDSAVVFGRWNTAGHAKELVCGDCSKWRSNTFFRVGCGTSNTSSQTRNGLESLTTGDLYIYGGYEQELHVIPAATSAYTLAEGCYSHAPETAPTYTLPAVTDTTRTHCINLTVDFTTVQTLAFVDANGDPLTPQYTPSLAAGDVYTFRCEYSAALSKWCIMPVVMS